MGDKADKIKGHAKEAAGDLTGDDDLKAKGKADRVAGTVKEKVHDVVDSVREKVDHLVDRRHS